MPEEPLDSPAVADLFDRVTTALTTMVAHLRSAALCSSECVFTTSPSNPFLDCSAYTEAVDVLDVVRRKSLLVLDAVASPIPGAASVDVPRGEVSIDPNTNLVVLNSASGTLRHTASEAIAVGTVLVAAGREAARLPAVAEVNRLAQTIARFADSNVTALARHLLSSGYQRTGGSADA